MGQGDGLDANGQLDTGIGLGLAADGGKPILFVNGEVFGGYQVSSFNQFLHLALRA